MKMLHKSLAALMLLAGGSTLLYAAPGDAPAAKDSKDSKDAKDSKESKDAKDKASKEVWLTVPQLQATAEELANQASSDLNHVNQLRLTAQRGQDPIKLDCVNDKLLEMKGQRNLLDGKLGSVGDAVALVNEEKGNGAVKDAQKVASKIHNLREAADACIGSNEVFYQGDTQVDWNGPETDDPDGNGFDHQVEPPAYASPFS
ncbi:MAG TPA: hypothetical protein PLF40_01345 [Kofleriaceae bacterium]|nr:hypothetical protein [Kofleriaceae bacterium]